MSSQTWSSDMPNILEPQNPLLRKYIDTIYFTNRGDGAVKYAAYPSTYTSVGLFRDARVTKEQDVITIQQSLGASPVAYATNRLFKMLTVNYMQMVDEIAINFTPLGFETFATREGANCFFTDWDPFLEGLFRTVFGSQEEVERLGIVEEFLLGRYKPLKDEALLHKAIKSITDGKQEISLNELAQSLRLSYKTLYRAFVQNIGCGPAHFRKVAKFRKAVRSRLRLGEGASLTDICYDHDFTDQSYFIKQFRQLTGQSPRKFFQEVSSFGEDRVVFKYF